MFKDLKDWLANNHEQWTYGLIITALAFALIVVVLIWISTERRLWRANRTETIIDHRHSTPTTVDFIITNPLNMKGFHGSFFDPYLMSMTHGKDEKDFKMEYIGRMGNNYKYRISGLKPKTSYTDIKIFMGIKGKNITYMPQPVTNIWTRDEDDKIIAIWEATPNDKDIDVIRVKAENIVQRKVNEGYFKYALHYGNSKNRWVDVEHDILEKAAKDAMINSKGTKSTTAKKTTASKKTTSTSPAKKSTTNKKTTTAKKTTNK